MNQHLQKIQDLIERLDTLSAEEKTALAKTVKSIDADFSIAEFKLDRTEKIKRTTAILLEETIEELEHKRKAIEEKNRDLEIESALERVRTVAMGMRNPEDLLNICRALFNELQLLGFGNLRNAIIHTYGDSKDHFIDYDYSHFTKGHISQIPYSGNPILEKFVKDIRRTKDAFTEIEITGDELKKWQAFRDANNEVADERLNNAHSLFYYIYSVGEASIGISTFVAIPAEKLEVLKRFRNVFDLAYRRYADIEQAQAQAREGQIELSLERVRAKTMAMHTSEHVGETVAAMFDELVKLGIEKTVRCGILIIDETKHMEVWTAAYNTGGEVDMLIGRIDMMIHPLISNIHQAWKNKEQVKSYELTGEDLKAYYQAVNDSPEYPVQFDLSSLPAKQINNAFFFPEGAIFAFTLEPPSEEAIRLFKRFAGVFGLTYRRYLDLQKAEEQARESKIEAALEKVRGKAMAMYNSNDLSSTASMVFTELRKLGISPLRCGVGIASKDSRKVALYSATKSTDGDSLALMGWVVLSGHPVLEKINESIVTGGDYFPVLKGKQLKSYYDKLLSGLSLPSVPDFHAGEEQYGHFFPFQDGCLYAWAEKSYVDQDVKILKRFTSVIDLTFRRYIELQKSEANAREAVRQASLDRVRAEIASMRSTNDLGRITPLIWNELTILGIPFIRCGVFIVDEQEQLIHVHLSTSNGKALATFDLAFDSDGIGRDVLPAWRNREIATAHWSEEEFAAYTKNLVDQGTVNPQERYVTEHPDTSLDLHFFPFLQGMLYVGNTALLTAEEKDLVQSLANAFSTAYARYEDFNKLEAAKQQVENTLTDLKAAQTKLIQSEKMASLGELTAGIAHEIQNPLNFVNNFSEVNQEMIDELEEELRAGNIEEALAIAADIKQNEEKISHHGKRADGIVKGMLQHSRSGGGEKQFTNINLLADEFLRLSYHGLRAKDKIFNAELITRFDADLPQISVIPQDIGRVMLNLFNNAFYAVQQKQKQGGNNYKPTIEVTSFYLPLQGVGGLKVRDNGIGIPDAIKEKIMQPFFTTKPTGEGTGLGLSLTYDMVVKGHGGSIQVNSVEGEGSEFIIQLPFN